MRPIILVTFAITLLQAHGQCDSITSNLVESNNWSMSFGEGIPCPGPNSDSITFGLDENANGCWGLEWGSELYLLLEQAPESHDFIVSDMDGLLCFSECNINLSYSVTVSGSYSGTVVVKPEDSCEELLVPFSFDVGGVPDAIEVPFAEWDGLLNGGSSCPVNSAYDWVNYEAPTGTQDFYGVALNNGIEVVIHEQPEGGDFAVQDAYGSLCGLGALDVYYGVSTPGFYRGSFIVETGVTCNSLAVPFEFTIVEPDTEAVELSTSYWNGVLDGQSTCANTFNDYMSFIVENSICDSGNEGWGLGVAARFAFTT